MSTEKPTAVDKSGPTVLQALSNVMRDVREVEKKDRNTKQNFNFRGIDAVVNAVGPKLREHGVVVVPLAEDITSTEFQSLEGKLMHSAVLRIRWRFYGPMGDYIEAVTFGEAADVGDKAVPKAHSVAYRTVLLQALCIPTDEPDPDSQTYERVQRPSEAVRRVARLAGIEGDGLDQDVAARHGGLTLDGLSTEELRTEYQRYAALAKQANE